MNDFHATVIDWSRFFQEFETAGLGPKLMSAKAVRDHDEITSLAQNFLNSWLWERDSENDDEFPATLGFHRLGELAALYPAMRAKLSANTRSALDGLYVPFIGQWMNLEGFPKPSLSLPAEMQLLAYGGLSVAVSPESCVQIQEALKESAWANEITSTTQTLPEESRQLVAKQTEQLVEIVSAACRKSQGIIAVFEI